MKNIGKIVVSAFILLLVIVGCSNNMSTPTNKVEEFLGKYQSMDEDVLNLKLCDRLANVLDLREASPEFIEKYELETIVIINSYACCTSIGAVLKVGYCSPFRILHHMTIQISLIII